MQIQKSDLDFLELEKMTPTDLAKVAKEEEDAKKSASKQQKKLKKKNTNEKPPSESPLVSNLLLEGSSAEAVAEAGDSTIILDDPVVGADVAALESRTDV